MFFHFAPFFVFTFNFGSFRFRTSKGNHPFDYTRTRYPKMSTEILPPDVAAYLKRAATEIAKEQGFIPGSIQQLSDWMSQNSKAIGERAKDFMYALRNRLETSPALREMVSKALCRSVYDTVNAKRDAFIGPPAPNWNLRYMAYARSLGLNNPEEAFNACGGSNSGYLTWRPSTPWREFL